MPLPTKPYSSKAVLLTLFAFITLITANSDSNCCRKKVHCYECDSRFDPRCGDTFNLTRDSSTIVVCDDYCVKLKHIYENKYHFLRTCATSLKSVYIKKTEVCYATRSTDKGSLCFCEQDLCNSSWSTCIINFRILVGALFLYLFAFLLTTT